MNKLKPSFFEKTDVTFEKKKVNTGYAFALFILYIFSGFICINQLILPPDNYSLLWIPSGLGLFIFLELGNIAAIPIFVGNFIINKYAYFVQAYPHIDYLILLNGLVNAAIDVLQGYIAWKLAIRLEKKDPHPLFTKNSQLIPFFVLVCFLPSFITSFLLVADRMILIREHFGFLKYLIITFYFTVGNTLGFVLVAPIYWAKKMKQDGHFGFKGLPFNIVITIIAILLFSFYSVPSIIFLIIPGMVILARNGNLLHSILVSFIVCIILILGTANHLGFFGTHVDAETSFETVLFLLTIMMVLYFATIAFAELKLHQEKLQTLVNESVNTLALSEERYRMLAENIADVIWVWDLGLGKFTYVSPSVYQLRGLTAEEAMQETIDSSLEPESARKVILKLTDEIKHLKTSTVEMQYHYDELQQYKKDGSLIWIETVTQLVFNKNGNLEIIGVSRDINQRKEAEKIQKENENRLKELNATKDKFFSIIAHDLMNPFHTLIGFSSILIKQAERKEFESVSNSAKMMQASAEKTRNLLKNLLEWSYSQTDSISFRLENFDLKSIINEVVPLLKVAADQKGISIHLDFPEDAVLFVDKHMFNTILRNLISNAIKYTNAGGGIQMKVIKNETEWLFHVQDNGVGMNSEISSKIFEIGTHRSELGTDKEQGTGLGLILCKEFVERHRGKIWVESKLKVGSQFSFTIPIEKEL